MFDKVEAFYRPGTVREAVRLLHHGKGQARVVAGGTDVVVDADRSMRILIDITHAGLRYIRRRGKSLAIGATTKMADLLESPEIAAFAGGLLANAARTCGSVQIRNLATVGGNMAHASPAADMATPLLALDASAVVVNARGKRRMPLAEFLRTAHGKEMSRSLVVEIVIPDPPPGPCGWSFQKLGRTATDISIVNVAAGLGLDGQRRIEWARIALGAVAPTAIRATAAEMNLKGRTLDAALLAEAAETVLEAISPISDVRASAEYRAHISRVLTRRALEECAAQAGGAL